MLEILESTGKTFGSEIAVAVVAFVFAAIKRSLEKRKLRRKGLLRDEKYFDDELSDMYK